MPRNPNKRRCQTKGCKAYAMRSLPGGAQSKPGQSKLTEDQPNGPSWGGAPANHCRSHLDRVLGRRNVGAPRGNLNAVKTGRHAHPLSKAKLESLSHQIAQHPNETPQAELAQPDPARSTSCSTAPVMPSWSLLQPNTLILLTRLSRQLLPLTADQRFHIELYSFTQQIAPESRARTESLIWNLVTPSWSLLQPNPLDRLTSLREIVEAYHQKHNTRTNNPQ